MRRQSSRCGRTKSAGFCLVEVLISTGLLASALVALAYVFAIAARAHVETRARTSEVILATQKLEEFRALPFDDPPAGEAVEYLDASGRVLDAPTSAAPPAFSRRVRIEAAAWDPHDTVVIRVGVSKYSAASTEDDAVHLATVKTRKGS